jgi:hypothetical protein
LSQRISIEGIIFDARDIAHSETSIPADTVRFRPLFRFEAVFQADQSSKV